LDVWLELREEPVRWLNSAKRGLRGELRRRAPEAIDWAGLTAAGVVQMLDDFEAHIESKTARRH
jgi:hypothetical protein